jgi:hypothetical protein
VDDKRHLWSAIPESVRQHCENLDLSSLQQLTEAKLEKIVCMFPRVGVVTLPISASLYSFDRKPPFALRGLRVVVPEVRHLQGWSNIQTLHIRASHVRNSHDRVSKLPKDGRLDLSGLVSLTKLRVRFLMEIPEIQLAPHASLRSLHLAFGAQPLTCSAGRTVLSPAALAHLTVLSLHLWPTDPGHDSVRPLLDFVAQCKNVCELTLRRLPDGTVVDRSVVPPSVTKLALSSCLLGTYGNAIDLDLSALPRLVALELEAVTESPRLLGKSATLVRFVSHHMRILSADRLACVGWIGSLASQCPSLKQVQFMNGEEQIVEDGLSDWWELIENHPRLRVTWWRDTNDDGARQPPEELFLLCKGHVSEFCQQYEDQKTTDTEGCECGLPCVKHR